MQVDSPDLDRLIKYFKSAGKNLNAGLSAGIETALIRTERAVQESFRREGPGWAALRPSWVNWKRKHFFSPRKLMMTGGLYGNITRMRETRYVGYVYIRDMAYKPLFSHFGPKSKMRKKLRSMASSSRTTIQVGKYHEEGRGRNPKRAFIEPAVARMQPFIGFIFKQAVWDALRA
jgi:hypothetical protein